MENFQELFSAVNKYVQEKLNSPLLAPFIFAWFTWNHKFILIFFGSASLSKKIRYLDALYATPMAKFYHWVAFPLLASLAFVMIFPIISILSSGCVQYWKARKNAILTEIFKIQINYIPVEKVESYLAQIADLEKECSTWRTQIERLKEDNESLSGSQKLFLTKTREADELREENKALSNELDELRLTLSKLEQINSEVNKIVPTEMNSNVYREQSRSGVISNVSKMEEAVKNSGVISSFSGMEETIKNSGVLGAASKMEEAVKNSGVISSFSGMEETIKNSGVLGAASKMKSSSFINRK